MHPTDRRLAPARAVLVALALALALALSVAGCGGGDDAASSKRSAKTAASTSDDDRGQANAQLQVTMEHVGSKDGAGVPAPQLLACDKSLPASCSGTVRCPADPAASAGEQSVCAWLGTTAAADALAPAPDHQACTQQYGGPETAHVQGTLQGDPIDLDFSRQDGCAISRWDAASILWNGDVPTATAGGGDAAAGACLATGDQTLPPSSDELDDLANDATCGGTVQPEVIDDPPSAFER